MADNPDDIEFCRIVFKFNPLSYQEGLLTDRHDRIAVRFCRQAGKTTTVAAKAILTALRSPKITVLIVAPGMRRRLGGRCQHNARRRNIRLYSCKGYRPA